MEFPELGVHCAQSTCSRLDFLPFTCDACHKVFCLDHKTYTQHNCTESYSKDVHVPVCPLCNQAVPINKAEDPNVKVDQHIRNDCKSEAAKKLYVNRCSYKGCKKKEVVQVKCNTCHQNFCLKHRLETVHKCEGHPSRVGRGSGSSSSHRSPQSTTLSSIGAELNRERLKRLQQPHEQHRDLHGDLHTHVPSNMGEDEAMAAAIAASLNDPDQHQLQDPMQHDEDEALAQAVAASLRQSQSKSSSQKSAQSNETCNIC